MAQRESTLFMANPRKLERSGRDFSLTRGVFRLLNGQKVKALRANVATPRAPVPAKVNAPTREAIGAQQQGKTADTEDRAAKAEAALAQAEKEKADLRAN